MPSSGALEEFDGRFSKDLATAADSLSSPGNFNCTIARNSVLNGRGGGIFATRVHGAGFDGWPSVSSLGTRPTVDGAEPLLEAHLFDFDGDLYGRRIEVEFVGKLRDELRFDDLDALTAQMHLDARQARDLLGGNERRSGVMA